MKNQFFLVFAAIISMNFSFGQETVSKYYWGVHASGDYAYRTLIDNTTDEPYSVSGLIDYRNDTEKGLVGFHAGGRVGFNFTPKFGVETGVTFSRSGYASEVLGWTAPTAIYDPELPSGFSYTQNLYYLSVPILANFSFGKSKLKFITSIGLSTDFLVLAQSVSVQHFEDKQERNSSNETDEYQGVNLTPQISTGISYQLKDKLILRAQPIFQYGILKIIDTPVSANVWSAGINCGVYFAL